MTQPTSSSKLLEQTVFGFECPLQSFVAHYLSAIDIIDRAIPQAKLDYSLEGAGVPRKIKNRSSWLRERLANADQAPLLANGNEDLPATLMAMVWRGQLAARDFWHVTFETMPSTCATDCAFRLTLELGNSLHAFGGRTVPRGATGGLVRDQFIHRGMEHEHEPPYDLPTLYEPHLYVEPDIPQAVDWINYWSPRAVELMGYSEDRHAHLFVRHARGASGSLAFQVTAEPLDLNDSVHRAAVNAIYAAFPGVGGREPRLRQGGAT